jgi:hypothetical protein
MLTPFEIKFPQNKTVTAVNLQQKSDIVPALQLFGLKDRPVISIIGGAGGMSESHLEKVKPAFKTIVEFAHQNNAVIVDGGTDSGVMRLLGQTKKQLGLDIALVGIAAGGTVLFPRKEAEIEDAAELESNHDIFLLVPGKEWGDESEWINGAVNSISDNAISILINGGQISKKDFQLALDPKRPMVVLAGTGRLADEISTRKANSPLVKIINGEDHIRLRQILSTKIRDE